MRAGTIVFPGGSRVIAVPGRPETVRGYSANVLLTEFAFFEQPDATWRAILPSITNSMRGGVKKVRLITTPNGVGNKAHELWVKNFRGEKSGDRIQKPDGGTPSGATGTIALPGTLPEYAPRASSRSLGPRLVLSFCGCLSGGGGWVAGGPGRT